jgi:hypothetical protein
MGKASLMFDLTHKTVAAIVLGLACFAVPCVSHAAKPVSLSGAITGAVLDPSGVPQMGAAVFLFNRQERLCERVLTDERGEFRFLGLFPDVYSVRVTLAAFVPALRRQILVQPGMRSVLAVNLSTLFSSVRLSYPPLENGSFMVDDWKWMLRGSSATRPVLRFAEELDPSAAKPPVPHAAAFSETRGLFRVSGGDGPRATGIANEADLGTAFALATSLFGSNTLQVSGNVGFGSQTGVPMAAFRTSYRRRSGFGTPEVSVTLRQLYGVGRLGADIGGGDAGAPLMRSLAASFDDQTEIMEGLNLQYGVTMDSVYFVDHINYFSPYARMSYATADGGEFSFAYSSGNARPELAGPAYEDVELQRGLDNLGLFPLVSTRGGRARIQRGEEYEFSYLRKAGSRTYQLSTYHETVRNAALSVQAPDGFYDGGEVLPDLFSGNSIFNAGNYSATGYMGAVTQEIGPRLSGTLMFGSMGALTVGNRELVSNDPEELRSLIRTGRKLAATARLAATLPGSGTHVLASYQWTDHRWAMPGHLYSTQSMRPLPGLNVYVRQPVPGLPFRLVRMEVTADLRNLLAQGYLPLATSDGRRVLLVQYPRSLRGGLNFIF